MPNGRSSSIYVTRQREMVPSIEKMREVQLSFSTYWMKNSFLKSSRCCLSSASSICKLESIPKNVENIVQNFADRRIWQLKERVKHRGNFQEVFLLLSYGHLQQPLKERKIIQAVIDRICGQFLQICVSFSEQLLQYTGIGISHGFRGTHAMTLCHFAHSGNKYLQFPHVYSL